MSFADQIMSGLKARFSFKSERGAWLQGGTCPSCGKKEVYCASDRPKMVKCGRIENCGWEDSVRNILPDLFEDWSKRAPQSEADPTATADAYLIHERGLDLQGLRGSYTQENYVDRKANATSATIRFPLPNDSWWERLIDRPGRFARKANFKYGSNWQGHWWAPPGDDFATLATVEEIWLAEGIFDALALRQVGLSAVSLMSVNNWPEHALTALQQAVANGKTPKQRPRLIFAFDVGKAGVSFTRKFVKLARAQGWDATAAQVRPDGEGTKHDWNDLLLQHQAWRGDEERAPFSDAMLDEYLWNGAVTIAETAREKAKLIHSHRKLSNFDFRFDNRMWSAKVSYDEDKDQKLDVVEIANCAFRILYRERDEILDETNYFLQIDFPYGQQTEKARFSAAACAASGEFKKRLMAFAGMWAGSSDQLDRLMRIQTKRLKTVEPIAFTGYSPTHRSWVLGDIAVREGRLVPINGEKYFDLGKSAVKMRSAERILDIAYNPDQRQFPWVEDIWAAWGERGLVALSFFVMSLFAVQIRKDQQSLGFLEVTGEPGSGKTTLVTFLWKMLGRAEYEGFNPNAGTVAGVSRNFLKVSNLPVGLIEGNREQDRSGNRKQFDWSELLTLYNGRSPRVTGGRTGGNETVEPPFLGAIYLMQNERIDAHQAVLERLMSFRIDKAQWTDGSRLAARRLEKLPLEDVSGTIVHIIRQEQLWLETFFARFDHHDDAMETRTSGLHNVRCIKNHSQLAAALEATAKILPIPDAWIQTTIKFIDAMALDRQQSSGSDHPIVQQFWEKVDWLLAKEESSGTVPERDSINRSRHPDRLYAINLNSFEQRVRNANLTPMNMDELRKHLPGSRSRKFVAAKSVNGRDDRVAHSWVFENPQARPANN